MDPLGPLPAPGQEVASEGAGTRVPGEGTPEGPQVPGLEGPARLLPRQEQVAVQEEQLLGEGPGRAQAVQRRTEVPEARHRHQGRGRGHRQQAAHQEGGEGQPATAHRHVPELQHRDPVHPGQEDAEHQDEGQAQQRLPQEQPEGDLPEGRQGHREEGQGQEGRHLPGTEGGEGRQEGRRGQHLGTRIEAVDRRIQPGQPVQLPEVEDRRRQGGHLRPPAGRGGPAGGGVISHPAPATRPRVVAPPRRPEQAGAAPSRRGPDRLGPRQGIFRQHRRAPLQSRRKSVDGPVRRVCPGGRHLAPRTTPGRPGGSKRPRTASRR